MTDRLTDDEIAALEALEQAATAGPWRWWMSEEPPFQFCSYATGTATVAIGVQAMTIADAELIAEARNLLPRLLSGYRELERNLKAAHDFGGRQQDRALAAEARAEAAEQKLAELQHLYDLLKHYNNQSHDRAEAAEAEVARLRLVLDVEPGKYPWRA